MSVDFRESYDGEKTTVQLSNKHLSQLLNGKILEGFKTRIMLELNNNGGEK